MRHMISPVSQKYIYLGKKNGYTKPTHHRLVLIKGFKLCARGTKNRYVQLGLDFTREKPKKQWFEYYLNFI